jgi:hypothetical protein
MFIFNLFPEFNYPIIAAQESEFDVRLGEGGLRLHRSHCSGLEMAQKNIRRDGEKR